MFRQLLGRRLKSDEVLQLLRDFDMAVTYQIDVLQENTPDSYFSESTDGGFSLRFDENQILTSIFCYTVPRGTRAAVEQTLIGSPLYQSFTEAKLAGESLGISIRTGQDIEAFGRTLSFVRLDHADHSVHYEYEGGALVMVTLMTPRDAVT